MSDSDLRTSDALARRVCQLAIPIQWAEANDLTLARRVCQREKRKRYLRNYEKRRRERFLEILKMSDEEFLEEVVRPFFRGEI